MRTRLETLETVFSALREGPPAEAERLLHRIRTAGDVAAVLHSGDSGADTDPVPTSASSSGVGAASPDDRDVRPIRLGLPDADTTLKAVDSFFSSSGKLFHVFSRDQAMECYRAVFYGPSGSDRDVATSCLAAVAAVGGQYNPDLFSDATMRDFYDVSRHHFDEVLRTAPLRAVKVCTLMAMFNIMGKCAVALAFVGRCLR